MLEGTGNKTETRENRRKEGNTINWKEERCYMDGQNTSKNGLNLYMYMLLCMHDVCQWCLIKMLKCYVIISVCTDKYKI